MIEFSLHWQRPARHAQPFVLDMQGRGAPGTLGALFGPSGTGKSTLLRILAGLERQAEGQLTVNGEVWQDSTRGVFLVPQQRRIGMVFQDYALFPSMSVREQLQFAAGRGEARWVSELLEMTGLAPLAKRRPHELSGGQQQRVALARALARRPQLLLLDEPLSALDLEWRLKLQQELQSLHRELKLTTLLVSHDLSEVFRLADRVWQCQDGRIVAEGSPAELFLGPQRRIGKALELQAELLAKQPGPVMWVLTLLIGQDLVEILATPEEAAQFEPGQRLSLSSRAFSPLLLPLNPPSQP